MRSKKVLSALVSAALLVSLSVTGAAAVTESYDTFDYRAYANVYPDLKAAYGYNAEKLYAHYVNFGKAEGRVGTFIEGSNPKTKAPIYGFVPGSNQLEIGGDGTTYAVVPATLLDAKPPEKASQLDKWRTTQLTHIYWMSNAKLVAEYYHTQEYMGDDWGGSLSTEAVEIRTQETIPQELRGRIDAVKAVYEYEHSQHDEDESDSVRNNYLNAKDSGWYKRAMCSDTTILLHCDDYRWGRSTFAAPPADPGTAGEPPVKTVGGFSDVTEKDYFADPVVWAVERKITSGTGNGKFSPGQTCSRAQILSFLWRASGSPEPSGGSPFTDIKDTDYFYKAALWAAEKGMVSGSAFSGSTPCTRASTMEYLWKAAGSPSASYDGRFTDVSANAGYTQAIAWAVSNGVTSGTSKTTFSPDNTCTRGQIVSFLYRAFAK